MPDDKRGAIPKYPWAEWMDGQARQAERGVDYGISDSSLRSLLHSKAKERGMKVRCRTTTDGVSFQFWKETNQ